MGARISKNDPCINEDEISNDSLPSTPISTSKSGILEILDPRSPTANIVRTPIQVVSAPNKNQISALGELNTSIFEESILDDSGSGNLVVSIDPRSPTVEFIRTPIVKEKLPIKLQNKNLDNVKKQISNFSTVRKNSNSDECRLKEKDAYVKPILLETSPVIKKIEQKEKRKSYVGLLETNLDYIETNLDNVPQLHETQVLQPSNVIEENDTLITADEKTESQESKLLEDPRSPSLEVVRTPIQVIKSNNTNQENISSPIIQEIYDDKSTEKRDTCHENKELTDFEPELLNKYQIVENVLEKINQIDEEIKEVITITHEPVLVFESENPTNEFDKKVTNLIYEDQDTAEVLTPVKVNKNKDSSRTPLGVRNSNNHNMSKAASRLKVHDKPKVSNKIDYNVSKIPVFKEKKFKSRNSIQCENTPPVCKGTDLKVKKSQWDADQTLII